MGHQTQVKDLLAREQTLLSCINTMQDRFEEMCGGEGVNYLTAQSFASAYLRAYGILIGWKREEKETGGEAERREGE